MPKIGKGTNRERTGANKERAMNINCLFSIELKVKSGIRHVIFRFLKEFPVIGFMIILQFPSFYLSKLGANWLIKKIWRKNTHFDVNLSQSESSIFCAELESTRLMKAKNK